MSEQRKKVIELAFLDHTEMINKSKLEPIFINDIDLRRKEEQEKFRNIIFTTYKDATMSPIATCVMGCTTGQSNNGHICPECNTMVQIPVDREPEPIAWLRVPEHVDAFMSPLLFKIMDTALHLPNFSMMRWMMDPTYKPKKNIRREVGVYLFVGGTPAEFSSAVKDLHGEWKVVRQNDFTKYLDEVEQAEETGEDEEQPDDVQLFNNFIQGTVERPKQPVAIHVSDPELANSISRWTGKRKPIQIRQHEYGGYVLKRNRAKHVERFLDLRIPRGINYFKKHYRRILDMLLEGGVMSSRNTDFMALRTLIGTLEDRQVWSQYLPIPNRICLVVEEHARGPRSDPATIEMIDACGAIADIDRHVIPLTPQKRESRVANVVFQLGEFYYDFIYKHLRPDSGWFRGNVYGTSMGYSARTVITSIIEPHHWEELHYPWAASVRLLSEHISNRLQRWGYNPEQIHDIIADATNPVSLDNRTEAYDIVGKAIDELFELARCIPGTKIKGIPVLDIRYPSLYRGSIQPLWLTEVIRDPKINAARMPIPVLPAYNADFDGDELSLTLIQDDKQLSYFERLAPHLYAIDTGKPRRVSGNLKLPSPTMTTIANYIHSPSNKINRRNTA